MLCSAFGLARLRRIAFRSARGLPARRALGIRSEARQGWALPRQLPWRRTATILGFVGAGGIGLLLDLYEGSLRYDLMLAVTTFVVVTVIAVEWASAQVRRTVLGTLSLFERLVPRDFDWFTADIRESLPETVALGFAATFLGLLVALPLGFLAAQRGPGPFGSTPRPATSSSSSGPCPS